MLVDRLSKDALSLPENTIVLKRFDDGRETFHLVHQFFTS
jgi:hypothetical protein